MICPLALILFAATADNLGTAKSALEDGLPAVAIHQLEDSPKLTGDAVLILARAYLGDGKPEKALHLLETHPAGKVGDFWLAQACAALGKWEAALEMYQACAGEPSVSQEAVVGQARMLRNLGRSREALDVLEPAKNWPAGSVQRLADFERTESLLDQDRPLDARRVLEGMEPGDAVGKIRRDYLMARTLSLLGDDRAALALYDIVKPLDPDMAVGATCGHARSLVRIGQSSIAESFLEDFISGHPNLPGLEDVFSILDSIYAAQPSASSSELKRWAEVQEPSLRSKLADFYLARFEARLGREDRVEKLLQSVVSDPTDNPVSNEASLELAAIRLKQGKPQEAARLLASADESARTDFLRGLTLSALQDSSGASARFLAAASDASLAEVALYNAAVCDLFTKGTESPGFQLLQERFPTSPRLEELRLRHGYELARQNDAGALDIFENLVQTGPARLGAAANLALAEWEYVNNKRSSALTHLRRASTANPDAGDPQAKALSVFLLDDGKSDDAAISAATEFLAAHAGAAAEPEVMLKLGELLFRKGDFAGARVQLESLARKYPGTPLEFPALFLAAQSASRLQAPSSINDAMLLYEEVASSSNPLALRARFEQAILQAVIGKPGEAIVILDRILASDSPPEMRAAALMEKGKTLYELGESDPQSYHAAMEIWQKIVSDPDSSPFWRTQALTRIGTAYENLGNSEAAITVYYEVLKDGKLASQAFFWFYKAGFAAARLLESSKRWDQAIKVYEMIAAADGPRSGEATERINKIRLENFLWDGPPGS